MKGANIIPNKTPQVGIWDSKYNMPEGNKVERSCLKCDDKFLSKSKFNRICEHCKRMKEHAE